MKLNSVFPDSEGAIVGRYYADGQPICVEWREGLITRLERSGSPGPGCWIAPGLFDLQVNGYAGVDFQRDDLTTDQLLAATRQLRADGCTRYLLTLITAEWSSLMARLQRLRALRAQSSELTSAIAGWHVEGPFLSPKPGFHGTHNPAFMQDPSPAHIRELRALTGSDPVLLTLAPERAGALDAISLAVPLGIKVSLGHTDADAETLARAVHAGAIGFTHLGNGCPADLNRHDNILWRVLETPGLRISLIPDGIHVSPPFFRLVHRVLEPDSIRASFVSTPTVGPIYYVTDAMSAAGAPPGRYALGALQLEVGSDQIVRQPGQPYLSGSALRPVDGVLRAARMLGCSWRAVWARFSETPAAFLGLTPGLAVSRPANFCVLGTEGHIQEECDRP